jgi:hypothetical protein
MGGFCTNGNNKYVIVNACRQLCGKALIAIPSATHALSLNACLLRISCGSNKADREWRYVLRQKTYVLRDDPHARLNHDDQPVN